MPRKTPGDPDKRQPPAMLTVRQAARALGVSEQMVYRMLNSTPPAIEAVRVGRLFKILRREFCERFRLPDDYDFGDP